MKHWLLTGLAFVVVFVSCLGEAGGVIILGPGGRDTNPPMGALADSGWDLQGRWKGFLGTPIGPHHFITVDHVGGEVGDTFEFQGETFTTKGTSKNPDSDMRIWEINGTFSEFAPLYTGSDEVGRDLVVFGRGRARGDSIIVDAEPKGWEWGTLDRVQSWGTNTVTDTPSTDNPADELLAFGFDAASGDTEGALAEGDSGGGIFILDEGVWKLAGIGRAVSGPYRLTADGSSFLAAVFDEGGLFLEDEPDDWQLVVDTPADIPGVSFASRISSHVPWINSVLVPEPSTVMGLFAGLLGLMGRRAQR